MKKFYTLLLVLSCLLAACSMNDVIDQNSMSENSAITSYDPEKLKLLLVPTQQEQSAINVGRTPENPGDPSPISPNNFDLVLAEEKALANGEGLNEKFFVFQALYRYYLEQYLFEKLNLQQYDTMLDTSPLQFAPLDKQWQDYYQRYSTLELNHIYLMSPEQTKTSD